MQRSVRNLRMAQKERYRGRDRDRQGDRETKKGSGKALQPQMYALKPVVLN